MAFICAPGDGWTAFRKGATLLFWLIAAASFTLSDASAAQLKSVKVTETRQVPRIQPGWPVPDEPNQLFYLQRSTNSNTIVFTAVFDANGKLRASNPTQVYWRRYNTTGERKPLKPFERALAFGVNFSAGNAPGDYHVSLKPLPQLPMLLRQSGPGKAALYATLGGRTVRAVYAYANVDESGWIPRVTHVTLHGVDPTTGRAISETFRVSGGAVKY